MTNDSSDSPLDTDGSAESETETRGDTSPDETPSNDDSPGRTDASRPDHDTAGQDADCETDHAASGLVDGTALAERREVDSDGDAEKVEPVELLVQLAEDGEIDPWDIDVVTVTDKFLARLDASDLRTGGRALFYASVLLRMKSDALWHDDPDESDIEADDQWAPPDPDQIDSPVGSDPFDELEQEMDRRIERKTVRGTPETLDELVRDLREHERDTWWKESRTYDTSESPTGYARGTQTLDYHGDDGLRMDDEPTADDVTGTAHDEHMEDIINDVYVALQSHYDQGRDEVLFAEIQTAGGSLVNTFLGILFLAHRGQIRLQQDELFDDLWIQDPGAVPVEEPAPADD